MNLAQRRDYLERLDTVRSLSIFRKDWRARLVEGEEKPAPRAAPKAAPPKAMASMPPPQMLPRRTLEDALPSSLQPLTPSLESLPPTPSNPGTPPPPKAVAPKAKAKQRGPDPATMTPGQIFAHNLARPWHQRLPMPKEGNEEAGGRGRPKSRPHL
jgi:hypothetical protein